VQIPILKYFLIFPPVSLIFGKKQQQQKKKQQQKSNKRGKNALE